MLCAFASTAFAAEHYVEVWNPPEARIGGMHAPLPGRKNHSKRTARHSLPSADHMTPRRVAEPALRASSAIVPPAPAVNRDPLIAPKLGPDGRILQVSYRAFGRHAPAAARIQ